MSGKGCHFGAKETVCRSAPRTTSPWGSLRAVAVLAHRPGWTVAFPALVTLLVPWTASMDSTFIVHPASSFVAMW